MKPKNKRHAPRRFKKQAKPIVIHIEGLYIETSQEILPLLDFCRMITHSVKEAE